MNTKKIQLTKVEKLFDFPPLSDGKQGRVFTKHYSNLAFILNPNHFALLSFLVYQSGADNTLQYSEKLLKQYIEAVKKGCEYYGTETDLNTTIRKSRGNFEYLIKNGLLLPTSTPKEFMVNPCLTYSKLYVKAEFYKEWVVVYRELGGFGNPSSKSGGYAEFETIIIAYIQEVNKNMQRRKQ